MRPTLPTQLEACRITDGPCASTTADGRNGAFFLLSPVTGEELLIVASDGDDWEHVSVSLQLRTPIWAELCFVKDLFWDAEECVVQYHPPQSQWVNNNQHCLHLWRPVNEHVPTPPSWMVGVKDEGVIETLEQAEAAMAQASSEARKGA